MVNFERLESYGMDDLVRIMEILRAPDGCPWDRVQTHQSIRRNMLEEAYEVCEAIDNLDYEHMKEELGDVLLQVVLHARIAEEEGRFTMEDIVDEICEKMIRRHPHVFGELSAENSTESLKLWEDIKKQEKKEETKKTSASQRLAAEEDAVRLRMFQIADQLDVSLAAGTDGTYVSETEAISRIDGSTADCRQGIQAQFDGLFPDRGHGSGTAAEG